MRWMVLDGEGAETVSERLFGIHYLLAEGGSNFFLLQVL